MNTLYKVLRHPLAINCLGYGGLYASADISQQLIRQTLSNAKLPDGEKKRIKIDVSSASNFLIFGAGFVAPTYFFIYRWMDKVFHGTAAITVTKKVLFDQLVNSPPLLLAFFTGVALLEGKSLNRIKAEVKQKYVPTYVKGLLVWPPAQALNFMFIPSNFRVLYVGVVQYMWIVFLSYIKHQ